MPNARWWKQYYADERESLGIKHLEQLILDSQSWALPENGAIIFPHTRLSASGHLIATAARAIVESERKAVLALGVMHRPRDDDGGKFRGIHGPTAPNDFGLWSDEFSLDNFAAMLIIASRLVGKPTPKLIARYPFLTGGDPESLIGFEELQSLMHDGAALVATADMIHHGVGYDTPKELLRSRQASESIVWAKQRILGSLSYLSSNDYSAFLDDCTELRSDFKDSGPVLAALINSVDAVVSVEDLLLVDYSDVLDAPEPTWVAGALVRYGQEPSVLP